jgi:TolB-like protein
MQCRDNSDPLHLAGEIVASDLVTRLVRIPHLHVVSTMSTRALRARELAAPEASARLDTRFLVSGDYTRAGQSLRLAVELVDARLGTILWADVINIDAGAMPSSAGAAVQRIAEGIEGALMAQALARTVDLPLPALESYTLFFAALSLMHRATPSDFDRAKAMLDELVWRHARLPLGHTWLAKWHVLRVVQGWSTDPQGEGRRALDHTQRALEASSNDALALAICGLVNGYLRKDLDAAGRLYEQALASNPNEPLAWLFTATWRCYRDDGAGAEQATDLALRLSPLDPMRYFFDSLGATAVMANGNYGRAIALAQRSLRANRNHASTWRTLALAQSLSGDVDEARQTVAELLRIEPALTVSRFMERYPGRDAAHAPRYAQALKDAGVPA